MQSTSDETLRSRLIEAYEADPDRSKMGRLRKQYDTIIDLQKGGMSLEKILAVLNADKKPEDGLTMKTFNGYLYLLRKERNSERPLEVAPGVQKPEKQRKSKPRNTPALPVFLDDGKPGKAEPEKPKIETTTENKEIGFVDIFAKQAEREAKKDTEKKIQKIPRR